MPPTIVTKEVISMSFDDAYTLYYPKIRTYLAYRVANPATVEDLLQETFCKAWRAYATVDTTRNITSWFYCIARSVWIDHIRAYKEAVSLEACEEEYEGVHAQADAISVLELTLDIREALHKLAPRNQLLIVARAAGYTDDLLAAHLGLKSDTVRKERHRAYQLCTRALNEPDFQQTITVNSLNTKGKVSSGSRGNVEKRN